MPQFIDDVWIGQTETLDPQDGLPETRHVYEAEMVHAVNAALATGRPLLLRGDPGVGKSQVARAAAHALGRAFAAVAIDARSEASDLLYHHDVVARLAEAQIWGALRDKRVEEVREAIQVDNFIEPRPLWWGLAWTRAKGQLRRFARVPEGDEVPEGVLPPRPKGWTQERGWVVLIDEIDKADQAVPNGLLDVLGHGRFRIPTGEVIRAQGPRPLVVITTNEDRDLPAAFVRRCWVLPLALPCDGLEAWLVARGQAHYGERVPADGLGGVLTAAARATLEWRAKLDGQVPCLPGLAEYLDLVGAALELRVHQSSWSPVDAVERYAEYALSKYPLPPGVTRTTGASREPERRDSAGEGGRPGGSPGPRNPA